MLTGGIPCDRFVGDVAIKDGKVAAVGPHLAIQGAEEIDATGKHVMPGWTDVHTHYDAQVLVSSRPSRGRCLPVGAPACSAPAHVFAPGISHQIGLAVRTSSAPGTHCFRPPAARV
eukprot:SAG11_NODE_684_length_7743_cov_53.800628_1_plen_116_part_00